MSLTESNLFEVTKKQYFYKLKAYLNFLFYMAVVQAIAIFMSLGGTGGSGVKSDYIDYYVKLFSADLVIGLTLIGAFVMAIYLTTKTYRNIDFTLVSTRLSSDLSNIAFLLTAGVAGAITANLSGFLIRVVVYFSNSGHSIASQNFFVSPQDLLVSIVVTTLYFILLAALGYFLGMLAQLHNIFRILMGTLLISGMFFQAGSIFGKLIDFFAEEGSFVIFLVKVILTVVILFSSGILISGRREVRR